MITISICTQKKVKLFRWVHFHIICERRDKWEEENLLFLSRGTRVGTSSKTILCFILPISYIAARVEKSISIIMAILPIRSE